MLVLLLTSSSKLLAQWQGPYQIIERTGKVTYQVDMHDKRKTCRVFHVNMLKAYQVRSQEQLVTLTEEMPDEDSEADVLLWNDSLKGTPTVGEQLTEQQRMELQGLLTEIEDVLQANPGRTTLGEHHIRTNNAKPVKLPLFRLPHAYREQVRKELDEMVSLRNLQASGPHQLCW